MRCFGVDGEVQTVFDRIEDGSAREGIIQLNIEEETCMYSLGTKHLRFSQNLLLVALHIFCQWPALSVTVTLLLIHELICTPKGLMWLSI